VITVVGYGLGNIQAIANIYKSLGIPFQVATTAAELKGAEKVILPGVGAFDWAMERLNQSGMRECLDDLVLGRSRPVIGICVGMQMMANSSEEGILPGLGWIDATVRKFVVKDPEDKTFLPHMGWNDVHPRSCDGLFQGLESESRFYFLHSYYFAPVQADEILATTDYDGEFPCAVRRNNIFGVQFHPEKSHRWGSRLLKNFAEI